MGTFAGNILTQAAGKIQQFVSGAVQNFSDLEQAVADMIAVIGRYA